MRIQSLPLLFAGVLVGCSHSTVRLDSVTAPRGAISARTLKDVSGSVVAYYWLVDPSQVSLWTPPSYGDDGCSSTSDYPYPVKTVRQWSKEEGPFSLVVNANFFTVKDHKWHEVSCGQIYGTAFSTFWLPTDPKDSNRYELGGFFSFRTSDHLVIVPGSETEAFIKSNLPDLANGIGGIVFIQDGAFVNAPALSLHSPDKSTARVALALSQDGSSLVLAITPIVSGTSFAGMKTEDFASFLIAKIPQYVHTALMLDGGGSAAVLDCATRSACYQVPSVPKDRQGYRPVPYVFAVD